MTSWKAEKWVSFDTETTGFLATDRILELGLILYEDGKEVASFCSLVNPGPDFDWDQPGVKKALEINKIPKEQIVGRDAVIAEPGLVPAIPPAPSFEEVLAKIPPEFKKAAVWVAHNAEFDHRMMSQEMARLNRKFNPAMIVCTQKMEAFLNPDVKGWKLVECAERRGIEFKGEAHRADTDARVCGDIFLSMFPQLPDDAGGLAKVVLDAQDAWKKRWPGRAYDHKPVAQSPTQTGSHHCHAHGCTAPVKPELLMCLAHWNRVPRDIQQQVLSTYRKGQCDDKSPSKAWMYAADLAIHAVAAAENYDEHTVDGLARRAERARRAMVIEWLRGQEADDLLNGLASDPVSPASKADFYRLGMVDGVSYHMPHPYRSRYQSYRDGYKKGLRLMKDNMPDYASKPLISSSVTEASTAEGSASTSAASLAFRAFISVTFSSIEPSVMSR